MEMSMMHAGLAAGAALAALPVILHLFMRQTPKHVIFPALRLIKERQKQSKKRMRIKNWLLLLARMALVALMALALARPSLYREAPLGSGSQPTALGLVFDTSLSMGYIEKDKSRLDEAKERAREIVSKLPDSSLVFVVDSAEPPVPVGRSPSQALKRIDELTIRPINRPLNAAMGQVYPAVAECDRPRRIVHVLTDLSRTSWKPEKPAEGLDNVEKLKKSKGSRIVTFILGVASTEVSNVSVEQAEPSSSVATQGDPIEIRGRVRSQGTKPMTRVVEFVVDGKKKDEKTIEIQPGAEIEVNFTALPRAEETSLHQGKIKLSGAPDPFAADDERFFTFRVRPPLKVLLVYDVPYESEFVAAALDPDPTAAVARPVQVETVKATQLGTKFGGNLQGFATIFLLNVSKLSEQDWSALNQYVREGGGLVVAPGHLSTPESYNSASQLLPRQLAEGWHTARPPTTMGTVTNLTHPLFERYGRDWASMLNQVPVYKYWPVRGADDAGLILLRFGDGAPALIERNFKGPKVGKVLLWTLPLSHRADLKHPAAWSEFTNDIYGWSFFGLINRTVPYLAGATNEQLNFEAGESVLLRLDPTARLSNFVISSGTETKPLPSPSGEYLEVPAPQLGLWAVKAKSADNRTAMLGFSVNAPRDESRFAHLEKSDLDVIFGKDGYLLAEDADAHKEKEQLTRYGYEVFPWLMFLILMIVTLENILANTFYKEPPSAKKTAATA
jgi:Aerotolerance regulator N-terminal